MDRAWQEALAAFLVARNLSNNFYWCLNCNSGDTVRTAKLLVPPVDMLFSLLMRFPVRLDLQPCILQAELRDVNSTKAFIPFHGSQHVRGAEQGQCKGSPVAVPACRKLDFLARARTISYCSLVQGGLLEDDWATPVRAKLTAWRA